MVSAFTDPEIKIPLVPLLTILKPDEPDAWLKSTGAPFEIMVTDPLFTILYYLNLGGS